jgi:hypothetical protein
LGNFYGCAFAYFAWINELVKLGVFGNRAGAKYFYKEGKLTLPTAL